MSFGGTVKPPIAEPPIAEPPGPTQPPTDLTRAMVPNLRLLWPQLLVAGVFPIVGYALLRPHVGSDALALAAVLVFPVAVIVTERLRHGRFEPIGIIAMIGIVLGLIGALVFHGDALLLKVRESMLSGVFGVICLASLAASRPAMFFLARSFATGGDPERVAEFNEIWELPGVAHRFGVVTTVWGLTLIAEAGLRTALALTVATQLFLVLAQVINWTVLGALLWFTVSYSRAGERRIAELMPGGAPAVT
jgi:hypothetical protein